MEKDLIVKDLNGWAKAEVEIVNGELIAKVALPIFAKLDEAAQWAKTQIPGEFDDSLIDSFVAKLKDYLSTPSAAEPEAKPEV